MQAILLQQETTFSIPISDAINYINKSTEPSNSITKQPWFIKSKNTKEEISIINKIKLNVAYTPYYMYKIQQRKSPNCICGKLGTISHIILACSSYNNERTEINQNILKIKYCGLWTIQQLIEFNEYNWGILIKGYLAKCKM